jgi:hypothetical protein
MRMIGAAYQSVLKLSPPQFEPKERLHMSSSPASLPVQNPLNLILNIQPGKNQAIVDYLEQNQAKINAALTQVGTVHFARFLMIPGTQYLFVITTYDGDFDAYIQAFTNIVGDVFNLLLSCVDPAPPLPVQQNVAAFQAFVSQYNLPTGLYSAYPDCTVVQILSNGCPQ